MLSFRTLAAAAAGLVLSLSVAAADQWPSRTITAISTVSAGNAADTVARVVFEQLSKQLGQSIVIENRTGAGGVTGSASAAHADPDGYTLLLQTSSQGSAIVLHKTLQAVEKGRAAGRAVVEMLSGGVPHPSTFTSVFHRGNTTAAPREP